MRLSCAVGTVLLVTVRLSIDESSVALALSRFSALVAMASLATTILTVMITEPMKMESVMSSGSTPGRRAAMLSRKARCSAAPKSYGSPATVSVLVTTGRYEPPGLAGGFKGGGPAGGDGGDGGSAGGGSG